MKFDHGRLVRGGHFRIWPGAFVRALSLPSDSIIGRRRSRRNAYAAAGRLRTTAHNRQKVLPSNFAIHMHAKVSDIRQCRFRVLVAAGGLVMKDDDRRLKLHAVHLNHRNNIDADTNGVFSAPEQHAADRAYVIVVAAIGDSDVFIGGDDAIGWIEINPAVFG